VTPYERLEQALAADEPERTLRAVVLDLTREQAPECDLYGLLERLLMQLRAKNNGESLEDSVLNVMDDVPERPNLGSGGASEKRFAKGPTE
jgi:hypothetical protein